jgi:hypothetical protein
MKGSRPGKLPPLSQTRDTRRTCLAPECDTKLSMYNMSGSCWQHTDLVFPNYRGKRLSPRDA